MRLTGAGGGAGNWKRGITREFKASQPAWLINFRFVLAIGIIPINRSNYYNKDATGFKPAINSPFDNHAVAKCSEKLTGNTVLKILTKQPAFTLNARANVLFRATFRRMQTFTRRSIVACAVEHVWKTHLNASIYLTFHISYFFAKQQYFEKFSAVYVLIKLYFNLISAINVRQGVIIILENLLRSIIVI